MFNKSALLHAKTSRVRVEAEAIHMKPLWSPQNWWSVILSCSFQNVKPVLFSWTCLGMAVNRFQQSSASVLINHSCSAKRTSFHLAYRMSLHSTSKKEILSDAYKPSMRYISKWNYCSRSCAKLRACQATKYNDRRQIDFSSVI